uniref:Uncharacterized protein n=1 Tax=Tanacetum cinerariifolium TaxID=118510 RepID=A0A699RJK6_TANCI|nr:hypothetical protein [Tanacetum cinerariifolium]GFC85615.1 hypothetical protein [Tanacetum cinerariifolium]
MSPTPSTVKEKPHKSDKQMGSTLLRRCERGKNHVDVHASNVKSREKSAVISEEGSRDSNGGSKNRKRYHAVEFKAQKSPRFQESREVAPALIENPLEAESHDKTMYDIINQEKAHNTTPSVQQVASPVSNHSMPKIPVGYLHSQNL